MPPEASTATKARVVLVEDHPMFRERLAQMIEHDGGMCVAGQANNLRDGLTVIEETRPDAVIVDISLKGSSGLDLIKQLKSRSLDVPVLVLSMHSEFLYAQRSIQEGARGYVSKDEDAAQVMAALRQVLAGKVYLSPAMNDRLMRQFSETFEAVDSSALSLLSVRELEVFALFGEGLNTRAVAGRLAIGENTVGTLRQRIKKKLGLKDFTEFHCQAARWVREREQPLKD